MKPRFQLQRAAQKDLDDAFVWYEGQRLGLGRTWLRDVLFSRAWSAGRTMCSGYDIGIE